MGVRALSAHLQIPITDLYTVRSCVSTNTIVIHTHLKLEGIKNNHTCCIFTRLLSQLERSKIHLVCFSDFCDSCGFWSGLIVTSMLRRRVHTRFSHRWSLRKRRSLHSSTTHCCQMSKSMCCSDLLYISVELRYGSRYNVNCQLRVCVLNIFFYKNKNEVDKGLIS